MRRALICMAYLTIAFLGLPEAHAYTVGFSRIGTDTEWRAKFSESIVSEAKSRGIDLLIADADSRIEAQIAAVREFVAKRVDAIILVPVTFAGLDDVLREARDAKIPVFIADRALSADPQLYAVRIAADFNLEGKLAAVWLAQATRGRCGVVELQGTTGSSSAMERKRGFETMLALFPQMQIIASEVGNFTLQGGKAALEKILARGINKDSLCAVYAHNDDMMLGAIEALKAAGLAPGKRPLTVSIDGAIGGRAAVASGEINASVEHQSAIGTRILDVVASWLAGKRDFPKWVTVPSDLFALDGTCEPDLNP